MDKNTKNVIEAGITPDEFSKIVDSKEVMPYYLDLWKDQRERNYHLYELAKLRGLPKLAAYFKKDSIAPTEYYTADEL